MGSQTQEGGDTDAEPPPPSAPPPEPLLMERLKEDNASLRRAIQLLHRIANLVWSAQHLKPTCYALLTGVTAGVGLGLNRAAIFLNDEKERGLLRGVAAVGPADLAEADRVWRSIVEDAPDLQALYQAGLQQLEHPGGYDRALRERIVDTRGRSSIALAHARGRLVVGEGTDDLDGLLHSPTVLAAPMRGLHQVRGVLVADNRFTETVAEPSIQLVFELIADLAGRAVENAMRYERLMRDAATDALTGLGSRRSFDSHLDEAVGRARDQGTEAALVMIDLDDFKLVNDTHGHPVGDIVLKELGRRLLGALRRGEGFRYGGEELAVVMEGVPSDALSDTTSRIFGALTDAPVQVPDGPAIPVGCSIGVAMIPDHAEVSEALLRAADDALLRAKREGKNRVCLAQR